MPKEWVLNIATNRWGLNKKARVGPVSAWIRECAPRSEAEWESYYLRRLGEYLREKGIRLEPREYLRALGEKLYVKISETVRKEIEEITLEDCIAYIQNLVIHRTFEGYLTEKRTVYKQLEMILGIQIEPASDEQDRLYNVDFVIHVGEKLIGLQIKPITYLQTPEVHKWLEWQRKSHERFQRQFGGKVFVIFSLEKKGKKVIWNRKVIDELKQEMERLKTSER